MCANALLAHSYTQRNTRARLRHSAIFNLSFDVCFVLVFFLLLLNFDFFFLLSLFSHWFLCSLSIFSKRAVGLLLLFLCARRSCRFHSGCLFAAISSASSRAWLLLELRFVYRVSEAMCGPRQPQINIKIVMHLSNDWSLQTKTIGRMQIWFDPNQAGLCSAAVDSFLMAFYLVSFAQLCRMHPQTAIET